MLPVSRTTRSRFPALARMVFTACAAFASSTSLGQTHGTYLPGSLKLNDPDPPNKTYSNETWSSKTITDFTKNVNDADGKTKVGSIAFSYDTFTATYNFTDKKGATTKTPVAGAGIAGGFFKDPKAGVKLAEDFKLRWVQIVQSSVTSNKWGAGKDTWYPDTLNKGDDPSYPYQFLPGGVTPKVAPDQAMQDFPLRVFAGSDINWQAMLALAALNPKTCEARVIGMFEWGFDLTKDNKVTADAPHGWTQDAKGMATLTDTLTKYFDGKKHGEVTSKAWTINIKSPWVAIPTPATAALLSLAGLVAAPRRRAA